MRDDALFDILPPLCSCGGILRPDIIFFGEGIPTEAFSLAIEAAEKCDLMLIVGTSATVVPASQLPRIAKRRGAKLLEINPGDSELSGWLTDAHIPEPAGRALGAVIEIVREMRFSTLSGI